MYVIGKLEHKKRSSNLRKRDMLHKKMMVEKRGNWNSLVNRVCFSLFRKIEWSFHNKPTGIQCIPYQTMHACSIVWFVALVWQVRSWRYCLGPYIKELKSAPNNVYLFLHLIWNFGHDHCVLSIYHVVFSLNSLVIRLYNAKTCGA